MSFKDRAKAIRAQGAAERGNYSPKPNSLQLRMYQFWADYRPQAVPTRENFCHYWRVVLIWAPFWFLFSKLDNRTGAVVSGVLALSLIAFALSLGGTEVWLGLGVALGLGYAVAGIVVGLVAAGTRDSFSPFTEEFGTTPLRYLLLAWPTYGVYVGVQRLVRAVPKDAREKIGKTAFWAMLTALVLVGGGLLVFYAITETMSFLIGIGIVAGLALFLALLVFIADFLSHKHRESVDARTTYEEFDTGHGYTTKLKRVAPSKTAKFFMAIGDFLNLIVQVVRVKKWKICPIVEIPKS